jgi:indolepyruvate ferredoxin oxidoreductase alpha subunit
LQGKRRAVVEEGQPNFVEQNANAILRQRGVPATLHGKDVLPLAGEYNAGDGAEGPARLLRALWRAAACRKVCRAAQGIPVQVLRRRPPKSCSAHARRSVHARPPGFCTGCPSARSSRR